MARLGLDHVPILIQVGTNIPKLQIFRFEEFWLEFDGFKDIVANSWQNRGSYRNDVHYLTARFKYLRQGIKKLSKNLS